MPDPCAEATEPERGVRTLGDSWYAKSVGGLELLDDRVAERFPHWIATRARKPGVLRDALFYWIGRDYDVLLLSWGDRGRWLLILLEAMRGSRRLALLEFIPFAHTGTRFRQFLSSLRNSCIVRPLLRFAARQVHVLSNHEVDLYSRHFRIEKRRFHYLGWPMRRREDPEPEFASRFAEDVMVLASGRMYVDWATLFDAAEGAAWKLVVVCSRSDLALVADRARRVGAIVYTDISAKEHAELIRCCRVYVISLQDVAFSVGQIRVMNAVRAGAPIIASAVPGVVDYLEDGKTARLYTQGDAAGLRSVIDELIASPADAERLARNAWAIAQTRDFRSYLDAIGVWVRQGAT
jgi:glycosyltransferase involved in cell wall biosynthesis